jgi:hypothetical protein
MLELSPPLPILLLRVGGLSRLNTRALVHILDYVHLETGIFVSKNNIVKICNNASLLNIQIYIKTDELLFLPDKSLLNHNQENSSHLPILPQKAHTRRLSTEQRQPPAVVSAAYYTKCTAQS